MCSFLEDAIYDFYVTTSERIRRMFGWFVFVRQALHCTALYSIVQLRKIKEMW